MGLYEQVFIARQDISAAQVDALAGQYRKIAEEHGARIAREEYWGLKTMAYRIKKNRKGHYVMFHIDGPHAAITEIERNMRLSEDVLRYLTLRLEELPEGPSIMMQNRRDRRDRRDDRGRDDRGRDDRRHDDRGRDGRGRDDRDRRDGDGRARAGAAATEARPEAGKAAAAGRA